MFIAPSSSVWYVRLLPDKVELIDSDKFLSVKSGFLFYYHCLSAYGGRSTVLGYTATVTFIYTYKGKAVQLQAWSGPEGSRKLRFPDFVTTAQDGGKVVGLTHRPFLPPGNVPGTHFCYSLSRPQGHSAIGRILCQ